MAASTDEEFTLTNHILQVHSAVMVKYVKPTDLLPAMMMHLEDSVLKIMTMQKTESKSAAMQYMIQQIIQSDKPDILSVFGCALSSEYPMVWNIMKGTVNIQDQDMYEKVVKAMFADLQEQIYPIQGTLLADLDKCLSSTDKENIIAETKQNGAQMGAMTLLLAIGTKHQGWFPIFMWALNKNEYPQLVREIIGYTFADDAELDDVQMVCEKWKQLTLSTYSDEPTSAIDAVTLNFSEPGAGEPSKATDRSDPDGGIDTETAQPLTGSAESATMCVEPHALAVSVDLTQGQPLVTPTPVVKAPKFRRDIMDMTPSDTSEEVKEPKPIKLRDYQEELAADAMEGHNRIIWAETGTGKTHVAIAIAKNHFEKLRDNDERGKLAFFAPTTTLVEQQKVLFTQYLTERIVGLSGDSDGPAIESLIKKYDIFVLTPQILIDSLRRDTGIKSVAEFTLLIFDECHHAMKDHAYNVIMRYYHNDKMHSIVPQIVGLTASVGVGKAKFTGQAIEHILTLCANLDSKITKVTRTTASLAQYVNTPREVIKEVTGRTIDPFREKINSIMAEIEKKMVREAERHEKTNDVQGKLMKKPSVRNDESYTQWVNALDKQVKKLIDPTALRSLKTCVDYLKMYHNCLIINSDCRTKDALAYLSTRIKEIRTIRERQQFDDTDEELFNLYTEQERSLKLVVDDPRVENPKLQAIKNILLDQYEENDDSRVIIFCKTRDLAEALVSWISEDDALMKLRAKKLVGSHAPGVRQGMTQREQVDVLTYFKDGDHKIIVATTVAEEGLDIDKCNLVLRYDHVTNETARIQTKGRARAGNATFALVAERGKPIVQRENLNAIRVKMMDEAMDAILDMDPDTVQRRMVKLQEEARNEQRLLDMGKEIKAKIQRSRVNLKEYELKCTKCSSAVCLSSDIRQIQNAHYVNIDPEFHDQVLITIYNKITDYGDEFQKAGKLNCKLCGEDWGMQAIYRKVPLPVIKIANFTVVDSDTREKLHFKKWKDVPFQREVRGMTSEDLKRAIEVAQDTMPIDQRIALGIE